jgi:hypothetical protein
MYILNREAKLLCLLKGHSNSKRQFVLFLDRAENVWLWEDMYTNMEKIGKQIRSQLENK